MIWKKMPPRDEKAEALKIHKIFNRPRDAAERVRKIFESFSCLSCLECCKAKLEIRAYPGEPGHEEFKKATLRKDWKGNKVLDRGRVLTIDVDEGDRCLHFDGKGCSVYEVRPGLCRIYPFASKHWPRISYESKEALVYLYSECRVFKDVMDQDVHSIHLSDFLPELQMKLKEMNIDKDEMLKRLVELVGRGEIIGKGFLEESFIAFIEMIKLGKADGIPDIDSDLFIIRDSDIVFPIIDFV